MDRFTLEECLKIERKATDWSFVSINVFHKCYMIGSYKDFRVSLYRSRPAYYITVAYEPTNERGTVVGDHTQFFRSSEIAKRYWNRRIETEAKDINDRITGYNKLLSDARESLK